MTTPLWSAATNVSPQSGILLDECALDLEHLNELASCLTTYLQILEHPHSCVIDLHHTWTELWPEVWPKFEQNIPICKFLNQFFRLWCKLCTLNWTLKKVHSHGGTATTIVASDRLRSSQ